MIEITAAHWVYLVGIIAILATMLTRKNIIVPAVFFTFLTALIYEGSLVSGLTSVFNASLVSAKELFNIFLIIALVTGMLGALQALGSDKLMVAPFRPVMRNGHLSFWVLAGVTYVISLFFWPTPAVPLIGAVLIPVAVRAGLRPLAIGFTIAVAGQGMALSSDFVIRVAPGLSAKAANVDPDVVANRAMILSLVTGIIALLVGYALELRHMRKPSAALLTEWEGTELDEDVPAEDVESPTTGHGTALRKAPYRNFADGDGGAVGDGPDGHGGSVAVLDGPGEPEEPEEPAVVTPEGINPLVSRGFAIAVPLAYAALVAYLVYSMTSAGTEDSLKGGDAAALVGGIAAMTIFFASFAADRKSFLEKSAEHVVDGLVFAFRAMGVVLPIAGFFFIGNGDFSGDILGIAPAADGSPGGPALLFDLVLKGQEWIPTNSFVTAFSILFIGMIAGLEGSGFSGLPLTGSLSGSLGQIAGISPETLAAVGQMGNIWSGGGTLVAWSSLIAVAGFARVNVLDLARMCFIPVMTGLIASTLVAVVILG